VGESVLPVFSSLDGRGQGEGGKRIAYYLNATGVSPWVPTLQYAKGIRFGSMEFRDTGPVKMTTLAKVRPGKRKEFLDAMGSLQEVKLKQSGVTASKWHEDPLDPARFYIVDEWESGEDLKKYCRTDSFRVFLGALKTLCVEAEVKYGPLQGGVKDGILASFSMADGRFAQSQQIDESPFSSFLRKPK
jgi:quinol monooxygenase YgiN